MPAIQNIDRKTYSRGVSVSHLTATHIPATSTLRPLRDVMIIEPLEATLSAILIIINECKPVKGIVRAIGPGVWLKQYASGSPPLWAPTYSPPPKNSRTMMRDSKIFRPTVVKVGDEIELGGKERGGYAFDTFYHGDTLMLMCREEDVCGVRDRDSSGIHAAKPALRKVVEPKAARRDTRRAAGGRA